MAAILVFILPLVGSSFDGGHDEDVSYVPPHSLQDKVKVQNPAWSSPNSKRERLPPPGFKRALAGSLNASGSAGRVGVAPEMADCDVDASTALQPWTCSKCALKNGAESEVCDYCGVDRPVLQKRHQNQGTGANMAFRELKKSEADSSSRMIKTNGDNQRDRSRKTALERLYCAYEDSKPPLRTLKTQDNRHSTLIDSSINDDILSLTNQDSGYLDTLLNRSRAFPAPTREEMRYQRFLALKEKGLLPTTAAPTPVSILDQLKKAEYIFSREPTKQGKLLKKLKIDKDDDEYFKMKMREAELQLVLGGGLTKSDEPRREFTSLSRNSTHGADNRRRNQRADAHRGAKASESKDERVDSNENRGRANYISSDRRDQNRAEFASTSPVERKASNHGHNFEKTRQRRGQMPHIRSREASRSRHSARYRRSHCDSRMAQDSKYENRRNKRRARSQIRTNQVKEQKMRSPPPPSRYKKRTEAAMVDT